MKPDSAPPVAPGAQRASAREFFAVVFRRRWIILGLFVVTTLTVLTVAFTTPAAYVSAGRVLVKRGEQQSSLVPDRRVINDWDIELGSEVETVKSWPVLQRAMAMLEKDPATAGVRLDADQVEAQVIGKSNVLAISYQDRDPRVAERACDALLRAYIEFRQSSQLAYPSRFFEREIAQSDSALTAWSEMRRRFANESGVVDLGEQKRNLIGFKSLLEERQNTHLADLVQAQTEQRMMVQLRADPEIDLPTLGQPYSNESALTEIKRRIVEQQERVAQLRERYRDESAEVVGALTTLDTLRSMLRREVDARLQMAQSRITIAQSRLDVVNHDIASAEEQLRTIPDKEARLAEMDRQISSWKDRHEDLVQKSDLARINENTAPVIAVYLMDPASPARARNTRDYVRLALAPGFSLVVGLGLAFFVDGLDLTVHTARQAEEEVDLPVLAAVTERRRRRWRPTRRHPEKTPV